MNNLANVLARDFLATQDFLTVQSVPSPDNSQCSITLNLSWESAEMLAKIAAPILNAVSRGVDLRTDEEKKVEARSAFYKREALRQDMKRRAIFLNAVKQIYLHQISYDDFKKHFKLGHSFSDYEFCTWLPKCKIRKVYKEAKRRAIIKLKQRNNLSHADIAALFNTTKQNISNIICRN